VIQHFVQTAYLLLAIRWTFYRYIPTSYSSGFSTLTNICICRQWFWVQSGFLTLHTFTMIMKIHSYCSYNGYLSEQSRQLDRAKEKLESVFKKRGGKDVVLREAAAVKAKEELVASSKVNGETITTDINKPSSPTGALSRRRQSGPNPKRRPSQPMPEQMDDVISILEFHPDETVADLAIEINDLADTLSSGNLKAASWPANITYSNFWDYLLVPTLVYQLEYPRTTTCVYLYHFFFGGLPC
jgi:sterol O-acyltransferase